jgi:hypothetical protein
MKYLLLIHHGTSPTPDDEEAWGRLSDEEKAKVYAAWQALNENPKVTTGERMQPPQAATTVRVENGETLTTDGPFVSVKEALGGYFFVEADDLDEAIEIAASVPAAQTGGGVEIRPIAGTW